MSPVRVSLELTSGIKGQVSTYCTIPKDVRLGNEIPINHYVVRNSVCRREVQSTICPKASYLRVDSSIGATGCVENGVCLSLNLLFPSEEGVVRRYGYVSQSPPSFASEYSLRGVGMLSIMAAEKRPDAFGVISSARTAPAPALCPKIVTREGSPPKACAIVEY